MFGKSVSFSVDGEGRYTTWVGAICSVIIICLTLTFALTKFRALMRKNNTTFSSYTKVGEQDQDFTYGHEDGFYIAFKFHDNEVGADPEVLFDKNYGYFELEAQSWTMNENGGFEVTKESIPLHRCLDHDLKKFYQPKKEQIELLDSVWSSMLCMDSHKRLFGNYDANSARNL